MNHSEVYVQYSDGSKPNGKKVVLGFSCGMSKPVFTNRDGVAIVEHESVGSATVYVNGHSQGTFHAPGKKVVVL